MADSNIKIAAVVGTRPEAIKMAPLIQHLTDRDGVETKLISTGQHRSQLDQVFSYFNIAADVDLNLMSTVKNLNELTANALLGVDALLDDINPDFLLVQGDTTTAFVGALAAFNRQIPVGHVEAGLRSGNIMNPYPEEANRRMVSVFATLNFAPTEIAKRKLLDEGVASEKILVTGNTVVDALHSISGKVNALPSHIAKVVDSDKRIILVTAHRRESLGKPLENICGAIERIAKQYADVEIIFPVHKNPKVRETVFSILSDIDRVHLIEPLDYFDFISVMKQSSLILSDSGGVQEEAPSFGVSVLIMRNTTERPEALESGALKLVGTESDSIVEHAQEFLNGTLDKSGLIAGNPFGDGFASKRIVDAVIAWKQGRMPLLAEYEVFSSNYNISQISN
ncbi:non-hydrolyzing UDP-N-acetylglucosamine 2-epimerase [Maridesulfovibrio hydrothermalis]|uniref:UDP-N-acetylglucosamine 2-epimerase (non-hydrolyzing) n=1 Tax=Maridesulfovibrio hydrothermalis AM13 = DSM 14728 TaxID=1121451 RepID=L0RHH8_9BACT|nr:UDP-N-acetylglucosamine 2-epimerase (non-hydrolyzing) [Maridesulfovibrio hydrothermalis]CCO25026.1 UDP-N-acetylmannosamine 2-epimerase [Maridesulfovibrio hydrothermalis AM13 = DSM 14728]